MGAPRRSLASRVGRILAHVQHGVDVGVSWGLRKLREVGEAGPTAPPRGVAGSARELGRKALGFVGAVGDEYYRRYQELKTRSGSKQEP
jgi:hypothetical protein